MCVGGGGGGVLQTGSGLGKNSKAMKKISSVSVNHSGFRHDFSKMN